MDIKLTSHMAVAMCMRYVHKEDKPAWDGRADGELAAPRREIDKCARYGYSLEVDMTRVLKRKDFARWQAAEKLPDIALCKAVQEMESGLIMWTWVAPYTRSG